MHISLSLPQVWQFTISDFIENLLSQYGALFLCLIEFIHSYAASFKE